MKSYFSINIKARLLNYKETEEKGYFLHINKGKNITKSINCLSSVIKTVCIPSMLQWGLL